MDVNALTSRIKLSPAEQAEHPRNWKCFICHKVGCHSSKHTRYPKGGKLPQRNLQSSGRFQKTHELTTFINKRGISPKQALSLLEATYGNNKEGAQEWPEHAKEELVAKISVEKGF